MRRSIALALLAFALGLGCSRDAEAQGHGPAFGLSTPTLGKGAWSLDIGTMGRFVTDEYSLMLRPMLSYGLNENLQISASLPVPLHTGADLPQARAMTRMPMSADVELTLGWRFHRQDTGVGSRFESTGYLGLVYPTVAERAGVTSAPGLYGALATGYVSRTFYAWVGGAYRRYMTPSGASADHSGDIAMYSAVIGYRPPPFQRDYPHADWRLFVEIVGEHVGQDTIAGMLQPNTGGHQIFIGPTVLGLFGSWGISGGPVLPVYRNVNGVQPTESLRFVINTSFWFF